MRYLIDEFKKTATFFSEYSRLMRPITYTCYEDAVCFSSRTNRLDIQITFKQIEKTDDIQCDITLSSTNTDVGDTAVTLSRLLKHEGDFIVKFTHSDVSDMYAILIGNHLIENPDDGLLLSDLIYRTKQVIPNFINEVNVKKLIRAHYQPEKDMTFPNQNTVTVEQLDALMSSSQKEFATFDNTMTIAVVKLPCGFKVTGQSSCVDPANFDKVKGENYALEDAKSKLWELEGYLLANRLHDEMIRSYQGGI